jgi:hypothetical protein
MEIRRFAMESIPKIIALALVAAGLFLIATKTQAHHSGAMFATEVTEIAGTVKEFQWTNPHTWIQVAVETEDGLTEEWSIEWGSPNSLGRQGVRPNTFSPGARVTMQINPMRDGTHAGGFVAAKFDDGMIVGTWRE